MSVMERDKQPDGQERKEGIKTHLAGFVATTTPTQFARPARTP